MKSIYLFIVTSLFSGLLCGQQDPEARQILDRVSAKSKNYSTIQADFELTIENRQQNHQSSSTGLIRIKGKKYYMESMGTKVYFDGTTLYTFMEDINEVTISTPDETSDDFMENPALIFDFYNRDFKYHLVGEVKLDAGWMYEIDLFPVNLEQPYSRFKVLIKRDTEELYMIKSVGKDGIDYTAFIRNAQYDQSLSDDIFTFDPKKHKGIEIVDLRF